MFFGDLGGEIRGEDEAVARAQPARTLGEGAPRAAAEIAVERNLDRCRAAAPHQPRRHHFGVVEDEEVARPQQCRQIHDLPVLETSRRGDQQ